ncbi:MAG: hypothetical protein OSB69_05375 [Alphaproteobacteria bacterium]|nr:hypothetical protein [Alphaproteobacteria bacterium]
MAARRCAHLLGSITINGPETEADEAHISWFITSGAARGARVGKQLMTDAMAFCDQVEFGLVYLDTFKGRDAARYAWVQTGLYTTQ